MDATERPVKIPPEFTLYAEKHGIFDLYKRMLAELVTARPKDPLKFMMEYLTREEDDVPRIIILGPPVSGKRSIGSMLSKKLGAVLLTADNLLKFAKTQLKKESYISEDQPVTSEIWATIVKKRLSTNDAITKGWVLVDLPNNRELQKEFIEKGIFPRHYVILDAPDHVLIQRGEGKRVDPVTGDVYHVDFDWPTNKTIESRLVPIVNLTKEFLMDKFIHYHRSMDGVISLLTNYSRTFNVDQPKQDVFSQVLSFVCQPARSCAPRTPRVVLIGPPGSGKTELANQLQKLYKIIGVRTETLVQQEISADTEIGRQCQEFLINEQNVVPDDVVFGLLKSRLMAIDCATCGWILYDFPSNSAQAKLLESAGFVPNRVFLLDISDQSVMERLTLRSTDPLTGDRYHMIYNPPRTSSAHERLRSHPRDEAQAVTEKLAKYRVELQQIEDFYSDKLQRVNADQDIHTVFETIESLLINPVPNCK